MITVIVRHFLRPLVRTILPEKNSDLHWVKSVRIRSYSSSFHQA